MSRTAKSSAKSAAPPRAPRNIKAAPRATSRRREPLLLNFLRRWGGVVFFLLLAAILVHDLFGERGLLAMLRARREAEELRQEIAKLHEENRKLGEQVQALKSDPRLIERIAREEMNLARPGELIFKLPPKPAGKPQPAGNP
jgi:cell division protein FtsB